MTSEDEIHALEDELLLMGRKYRSRMRQGAKALNPRLDPANYPLILVLGKYGPLRLSELAEHLLADKSTLSRQVDAAARLGLVERVPDPGDARARRVVLTPDGQRQVSAQREARRELLYERLRDWPQHDVQEFTRLLRRLNRDSP